MNADTLYGLRTLHAAAGEPLLNGEAAEDSTVLSDGDEIDFAEDSPAQAAPQETAEESVTEAAPQETAPEKSVTITVNGITAPFPIGDSTPIFLDVAAAFSDYPTELLSHAEVITLNGRIARLDEQIHDGDKIVIE